MLLLFASVWLFCLWDLFKVKHIQSVSKLLEEKREEKRATHLTDVYLPTKVPPHPITVVSFLYCTVFKTENDAAIIIMTINDNPFVM